MDYKIRPATMEDLEQAMELVKNFHEESLHDFGMFSNKETTLGLAPKLKDGTLILEVKGEIVGLISGLESTLPGTGTKLFHEIMWFVKKEYRRYGLKLFSELEDKCRKEGYDHIIMTCLGNDHGNTLSKLYKAKGYRFFESHYIKNLT